ncbi:group III truncated hemoglobin [Chitinophaga horti]|uniref:Group III truncated hemoglobin n=1 Tax=Chitinophaga horti TaxID=2920382 RepID=A0ABY6J3F0_9BACT|nr:group III truncated hemoglobin [Chitinophaga horti]UYQ94030.1 group III truncated hemoglobin [Chitinophaga horti]
MNDISTREDLLLLVNEFYRKATIDPVIGHFFTEVIKLDFSEHIPLIASFWENILLDGTSYKGGTMVKHIMLNRLSPMQPEHFERWLGLWEQTVTSHFEGPKALEAVNRAHSIAGIMQFKVGAHGNAG